MMKDTCKKVPEFFKIVSEKFPALKKKITEQADECSGTEVSVFDRRNCKCGKWDWIGVNSSSFSWHCV